LLTTLIFILSILLTIFFVIGFHEFGHFIAARLLGIRVLRFSLGFGRILYSRTDRTGTEFALSAIPLGGYVKLLDEEEETVAESDKPFAFNNQPFWKKAIVIAFGPLFNLILAFILYWLIFMIGFTSIVPIVGKVTPHSIAYDAGLKPKQEIVIVDQIPVNSWMSVVMRILSHTGNQDIMQMTTRSPNGILREHSLNLSSWKMDDLKPDPFGSLGIEPFVPKTDHFPQSMLHYNQYGPVSALSHAWRNTYDFTWLNLDITYKLLTGKVSLKSLGGPISIFSNAGNALREGAVAFMSFLGFISISIGIINILPIPALDGGQLFLYFIEFITRRPIPRRVLEICYRVGVLAIIFLSLRAILNDILRL